MFKKLIHHHFFKKEIVFIENCNDKIMPDIQNIIDKLDKTKLLYFRPTRQKIKIKKFFEKGKI